MTLADFFASLFAYLLGSLSFAVIVSKAMGLADPKSYGSGNPGATNVLRSGSKKAAALTLLGDTFKGVIAVLLAKHLAAQFGITEVGIACVAIAVFLGHVYPVFFGFKGGKGVATAAGVLWALDWRIGLALTLVWAIIFAVSRVSSLSAIVASLAAPVAGYFFFGLSPVFWATVAMTILLVWRHRSNVQRLLSGEEAAFKKR
ncbi:MAG: glycerol-3-phosphate 1-O-acyltransferase PlsY [Burkholderiales bacterium]|nr:MAG: glycerol-3-phosphate 1-O-acyltransferase PlsY [Betaproteobacteria bacterium]TAG84010.1 MAG: glycerol-3-phosphate 1-O-acyltransferase PlsY [Burkholderiales bacterium]